MKLRTFTPFFFLLPFVFLACQERNVGNRGDLTMANYAAMHEKSLSADSFQIRQNLLHLVQSDTDSLAVDREVRDYYRSGKEFLWIDRPHVYPLLVDTLQKILDEVRAIGFAPRAFKADKIADDLHHLDSLKFDSAHYQLDRILARLEYNLTKGYLRFVSGERFGYMNPTRVLNHLDRDDNYPTKTVYRRIFDIDIEHPDSLFYSEAIRVAGTEEMLPFIESCRSADSFFHQLVHQLDSVNDEVERIRLLCNMERRRWRLKDAPENHPKRVVVNVPAFRAWAIDGDSVFSMKIACGATRTKTPLLTSRINRMEMNPLWIIPRSIIEKEVMAHVNDSAYFVRNRYFIRDKQSGDTIPPQELTPAILKNSNYMVAQERGAGNSLGRIIFRFPNAFAVYLHDTNSPGVFNRENRAVSHGCVRLERPLDMAFFLLKEKNQQTMEKIKYSTRANLKAPETIDKAKLLSYLPLTPEVPVFITYYTIYPDSKGKLQSYPDVYGYDRVLSRQLKNFTE